MLSFYNNPATGNYFFNQICNIADLVVLTVYTSIERLTVNNVFISFNNCNKCPCNIFGMNYWTPGASVTHDFALTGCHGPSHKVVDNKIEPEFWRGAVSC